MTTDYTLEGDKVVYETNGTDTFWYYYDESGEPVSFEYNGTTYYYVKNLQGDIIAILNASGEQVVEYKYDAWGNVSIDEAPLETIGIKNPYRYRGYRYDNETGLYYLQSRYYDPKIGRFINADSVDYLDASGTVLGCNLFAYCENNPVNMVDENGLFAMAATAIAGVGISAATLTVIECVLAALISTVCTIIICDYISKNSYKIEQVMRRVQSKAAAANNTLRKSLLRSARKALVKIGFNKPAKHHIVAKRDFRASTSRAILSNARIGINSSQNLVSIKCGLHFFIHTTVYHKAVERILAAFVSGMSKENAQYRYRVSDALFLIKNCIRAIDHSIKL